MPDDQTQNTETDSAATDSSQEAVSPPQTETVDWKSRAREWEKRAKDNKAAADELAQLKEAQKSEAQRQQEQLEEALSRATRTEVELWKERAARRYRLDEDLLQFLGGETEAEVDERAKTLAEKIRTDAQGAAAGPRRPAPDPSQGRGTGKGGAGGSVAAGRDLYQQRHGAKKT